MVIARVRDHVANHNWFAVLVDVAIVVLGVFFGTQVNDWNQRRIEGQQARDYRARLAEEVDYNARQFAAQTAYYRRARAYGQQALAALEGRASLSDRDFLIATYQLSQTDTTPAKTGIYDEMKSTGLVTRLGDPALQQMVSDYYLGLDASNRVLTETYPYRTLIREVMPYDLQKAIRDTCGDREVHYKGRLVGVRVVVPCPVVLDADESRAAVRLIRATPRLRKEMTRYIASIDEKLDQLIPGIRFSGRVQGAVRQAESTESP